MVVPYMQQGDLINLIIEGGRLTEDYTKIIMADMLNAVAYLAHNGIAHLDIKPDNILLADNWRPILFDFGLADHFASGNTLHGGSKGYTAPEVLQRSADFAKADVWSSGAVMYVCLYGERLFGDGDAPIHPDEYRELLECRLWREKEYPLAHDLLRRMLALDPSDRIDARTALQHRWLQFEDQ